MPARVPNFIRAGGTNDQFLEKVYWDALGRPIDATGTQSFGQALAASTSRQVVALGLWIDADGIEAAVEQAGPRGGDGNHDGIPDSEQADLVNFVMGNYQYLRDSTGLIEVHNREAILAQGSGLGSGREQVLERNTMRAIDPRWAWGIHAKSQNIRKRPELSALQVLDSRSAVSSHRFRICADARQSPTVQTHRQPFGATPTT